MWRCTRLAAVVSFAPLLLLAVPANADIVLSGGTESFSDALGPPPDVPAGALGSWTFDDGTVNEALGRYASTQVGGSFSSDVPAGLNGQSVNLSGNGYISVDDLVGQTVFDLNVMSIAFWAKGWPGGAWQPYISKRGESGQGWQVRRQGGSGNVMAWTLRGPGNDDWGVATSIPDGEWHHIVATYGDGFRRLYENGVLIGQEARSGAVNNTGSQLVFGARDDSGNAATPPSISAHSNVRLDDIYIYDRVLTQSEIHGLLPARTSPDVSAVNVNVTNPAAPSTLDSTSSSSLAFAALTLEDGTTLRTTGGDMSFSSVGVTGPAGRRATLATENNVSTANYSDSGTATTLVKTGAGTLTLAPGGTLSAAATTFEVNQGTFALSDSAGLSGPAQVVLDGATLRVAGEATTLAGMRGSIFFGIPSNESHLNLDGAGYEHSVNRVLTGDKAGTILIDGREDARHNTLVTGTIQNWNTFPTFDGNADNFVTAFSGVYTPRVSGNHTFRWSNDDRGLMFIDLDGDGVFQSSDRVGNYAWNSTATVDLVAGQPYSVIKMAQEYGGGQSVNWWLTEPGGSEARVNPTDGRGTWETLGAGPIDLQITLTVDNRPADALMGSIFFGIPRNESHLNLDGASYQHNLTRVITGDKADTILIDGREHAPHNTVITGTTQNWDSFPTFGGGADDFVTAFSGTFTPRASGSHTFRWSNDDRGLMYLDLDGDGVFQSSDRVGTYAWNSTATVNLTAGQSYSFIKMAQEYGGGQSVNWFFTEPGGSERRVNPGDPNQAGLWGSPGLLATSTLDLVTDSTANLQGLVLKSGNLRITGGTHLTVERTSIDPGTGGAVGLVVETPTLLTGVAGINGNNAAVTITKSGPATLTIDRPGTGLQNADFRVDEGTLHAIGEEPFGPAGTTVTLAGGTFRATGPTAAGPLVRSPLGHWSFDDDDAADASGNENHGIVGQSLVFQSDTPAGIGSARSLRSQPGGGAGNVVTVPTSPSLESINDAFSIAYWMKANLGDNGNWVRLFQHGTEDGGDRSWMVNRNAGNNDVNVRVDTTSGGQHNQNIAVGGPAVFDDQWHHVVFTVDTGAWRKYVDGVQVGAGGYNHGDGLTNTRDLYMLGRNGVGDYVGALDQIYLFDAALTVGEVASLYSNSHLGAINLTTTNIRVAATSTLHAETALTAAFGNLTFENGALNITGAPGGVSFTGGSLDPATTSYTLNNPMDVSIDGPFDGGGATADFTKTGAGRLTLAQGTTNHGGVSVNVQQGRLVAGGPMQAANLTIDGAANADTGTHDVTISNGGQFKAGSLTIAGAGAPFALGGDNLAAGPERLTVTGGTVTVHSRPDGLIGYWPFSEGAGTLTADASGYGNPGTINPGTAWVDDPERGWVLNFPASGSVTVPAAALAPLAGGSRVTISLWQYGDEAIQPRNDYVFEGRNAAGQRVLSSHLPWSNSNVYWDAGNVGGSYDRLNRAAQSDEFRGTWRNWTFVKDATTGSLAIYLDGELWHSGTGRTRTMEPITSFRIGSNAAGGESYAGMIDDFAVFDRALSGDEIQAIYAGTFFEPPPLYLPDTNVNVTANATLLAGSPSTATFGNLSLTGSGVNLTLDGAPGGFTFRNVAGGNSITLSEPGNTLTVTGVLDPGGDPTDPAAGVNADFLVSGNLTLDSGAAYRWEAGAAASGEWPDSVHVGGDLTLSDWTLAVVDPGRDGLTWDPLPLFLGFESVTWDPDLVSFDFTEAPDWLGAFNPDLMSVRHLLDGPRGEGLYLLVPEPSSLLLLVLGVLALLPQRRRKAP